MSWALDTLYLTLPTTSGEISYLWMMKLRLRDVKELLKITELDLNLRSVWLQTPGPLFHAASPRSSEKPNASGSQSLGSPLTLS